MITIARTRGFTLIELLVVISIIAVLASMLMPVVGMVRGQAQSIICKSQLRQVILANITYRNDNEGIYPQIYWNDPSWSTWSNWAYSQPQIGHWQQFLEEYTETFKVFNCPVSTKLYPKAAVLDIATPSIKRGAAPGGGSPGWPTCTMAINSQNFARAGSWAASTARPSGPLSDGKIQSMISLNNATFGGNATLARCPVYFDGVWQNDGTNHQNNAPYSWNGSYWPHRGVTSNMAFSDGHTEIRPYRDVLTFATGTTILQIKD